ncbi:TonB-dependent receptor [Sphingomonas naphthae]|uniref:TonB-dependent receptor n=1 Tax=Sphingomonas naphthae TaxID=1813468 RepID=A0ABY7TMR2_9SPHN|nr:TonB-dependent receptor [Sphingomonas naphthae]WCT74522.1 TonB-dependent receptor [Sphingomonas naphthae]
MKNRISLWLCSTAGATLLAAPALAQTSATPAAPANGELPVQEIVVTAQKRSESLRNVPASVTALGGVALESSAVLSVNDALRAVPGITSYNSFQGGMTKFSVRGVSSNPSLFNGSSVVGYYLDEIPFAFARFPVSPDANAYDMERVEILRGPQGTLYGSSALNGVVRVLTRDANLNEFQLKARGSASSTRYGGDNLRGDVAVNIPIVPGRLAVRAVGGYSDYAGWIDLPIPGIKNVNDSKTKNLRLKANAEPVDNLNVEGLIWINRNDIGSSNNSRDDKTWLARFRQPASTDFDAYGLTVSYDFPTFSLLSATSHIKFKNSSIIDAPVGGARHLTELGARLWSQEVRAVSSNDGPWGWSIGGIYRDAQDNQRQNFDTLFSGLTLDFDYGSKSYAVFGEISRKFLDDRLTVTGGLRYFKDKTSYHETSYWVAGPLLPDRRENFDAVTPRAVIAFRPNTALSLYASYSQGFRSGFSQNGQVLRITNAAQSVRPDRLHNYEIGAKGRLADGLFEFDTALYYIDWKDTVQVLNVIVQTPAGQFGVNQAINSGSASGLGADLAVTVRPARGFDFGGTISVNNLEFDQDIISGTAVLFRKSSRLPESAKMTATAQAGYAFAVSEDFRLRLSTALTHMSKIYNTSGFTLLYGNNTTKVDTEIKLTSTKGWNVSLFADNITDDYGRVRRVGPQPVNDYADRLRPRTIGVQFELEI